MPRFLKNVSRKAGAPPGTLIHIGERRAEQTTISLITYDAGHVAEHTNLSPEDLIQAAPETNAVRWINITGLHDTGLIEAIGRQFDIHPLTLEDIVNTGQRPKTEVFDDYLYAVIKMLHYQEGDALITSEQVSLILKENVLISFQERDGDVFNPVRERLRKVRGRLRNAGSDSLAHALIDTVVDHYYRILEDLGEAIETLEADLLENPTPDTLHELHKLKRETVYLRKHIWPLRETVNSLARDESAFITETTRLFMRDVHDHTVQVIEIVESYRDILSGLLDLYMSGVSNRMNEVMKVLTIIATIFIPITFVAGVYGMNFRFMPELDWRWGYAGAWSVMAAIVLTMILYFKKKKWW